MKNQFKLLKEEVQKHNNPAMNTIIDLLEEYNNGLSTYFKDREITRDFMDTFDVHLTYLVMVEKFGEKLAKTPAVQQLATDLNTLARSTWYFEREDGIILTGQTLYENKAVYMASITKTEPVYKNDKDAQLAEEIGDINDSGGILFKNSLYPLPPESPEPIGYKDVEVELSGEENASTIEEMVSLISFHAIVLGHRIKNRDI